METGVGIIIGIAGILIVAFLFYIPLSSTVPILKEIKDIALKILKSFLDFLRNKKKSLINKIKEKKRKKEKENNDKKKKENGKNDEEEIYPYKFRYLFTKREYAFYKVLKELAEKYEYNLMAKIRLADLIEVDTEKVPKSDYMKYFRKISQKHVDFVLANKETNIVEKIVEIDDSTHHRTDRKNRDDFVNKVLETAGYKVYHIWEIDELETIFEKGM